MFSGTGVVSRIAKQRASLIVANDLEQYSKIFNNCYLSNKSDYHQNSVTDAVNQLNKLFITSPEPGFISDLYAPKNELDIQQGERVFYTRRNALFLDTVASRIVCLDDDIKDYLLAPILYQASVSANTSGVFKGFHKNKKGIGQYGGSSEDALKRIRRDIHCIEPVLSHYECDVQVTQCNANVLAKDVDIKFDVAYLDPPYNQHPYGSNYFMLNLLCDYKRPEHISAVSGIPKAWNRSDYNKRGEAQEALFDVIENIQSRFVLVSYNSEGFISSDTFIKYMNSLGNLSVMDTKYNTFRGCRNLNNRDIHTTEFLFLLDKK